MTCTCDPFPYGPNQAYPAANPLCPVHGDCRDTNLAPVIPFPLERPKRVSTVVVQVLEGDAVKAAELVADALCMASVPFVGEIEVSQT